MDRGTVLRVWVTICALAGAAFFISQLWEIPVRSAMRGYDNTFNYLWLRSAFADGDWDFENDLRIANTLASDHRVSALDLPRTKPGRIPNKYGVGWALLTVPAYVVAEGVLWLGREVGGRSWRDDGYGPAHQIAVQCWHLLIACAALWLAWRAVARWIADSSSALAGVVAVWAASPLLYYQTANLSMSHGAAFFAIALFAYALGRANDEGGARWWLLAGAGWGLAVITRFQLAVFALVVPWVLLGSRASSETTSRLRHVAQSAGGFALGALPLLFLQVWAWRAVYGEWFVFSYGAEGEGFQWGRPKIFSSLFSSWHGLFYWHPLLVVAALGLCAWAWRTRGDAVGWMLAVASTGYVAAAWWCWWFASSFGNRAYDAALLPLMAGMAWWFSRARGQWRTILWMITIVAGVWNFYVAALYRTGAISRNEPVTWGEMIEAAQRLPDAARF